MGAAITFGRYLLLDRLAVGGMAELFLARAAGPRGFLKPCVIKRVLPHLAMDPQFVEMFLTEARLAANLSHPGVVQVFDLGQVEGTYYLAMEYLAGEDLAALGERCAEADLKMPLPIALRIIATAARALHYVHELRGDTGAPLGIVHRDISPSNLFVTYQGAVKVLDFGIARASAGSMATMTGGLKGKVAYMPPEQAHGKPVDRRADVWALGVCLHELLTGLPLFRRSTLPETVLALCGARIPDIRETRPDAPESLVQVFAKALNRDAAQRYSTAGALAQDLERVLSDGVAGRGDRPLADFLVEVFGAERADQRIRRFNALAQHDAGPATASLQPVTEASTTVIESRRSGWRGRLAVMLAAAVAMVGVGIVAASAVWRRTEAPVVESPSTSLASPRSSGGQPSGGRAGSPIAAAPAISPSAPAPRRTVEETRNPAVKGSSTRNAFVTVSANLHVEAYLDRVLLGVAPLSHARVPAGKHWLTLRNRSLGVVRRIPVVLSPNQDFVYEGSFGRALLNVTVSPWADVFLDDQKIGQTPLAGQEIWEGHHRIRLAGPHGEKSLSVDAAPGQTVVIREIL